MSVSLEDIVKEYAAGCERQAALGRMLAEFVSGKKEEAGGEGTEGTKGTEGAAPGQLLTTPELAAMLRVSRKMLASWRCTGQGPNWMMVGRLVRYRMEDVLAWQEARRVAKMGEVR